MDTLRKLLNQRTQQVNASRRRKYLLAVAVAFALISIPLVVATAYSYLSSDNQSAVNFDTAATDQIWSLSGSFDAHNWQADNKTGIMLTNNSNEDLWIYFDYTGDLRQVFQAEPPLLLPKSGEGAANLNRVELELEPLDDNTSPRVLNPLDLVNSEGQWKVFSGSVRIYTLNKYAELESPPISISGQVLWNVMFKQKYGIDLNAPIPLRMQTLSLNSLETPTADILLGIDWDRDLNEITAEIREDDQEYIDSIESYERLSFMDQVVQVIDQVAPGLMEEHDYLAAATDNLLKRFDRLHELVEHMQVERDKLRQRVNDQDETISQLSRDRSALQQQIDGLLEQIKALSPAASSGDSDDSSPPVSDDNATPPQEQPTAEPPASGEDTTSNSGTETGSGSGDSNSDTGASDLPAGQPGADSGQNAATDNTNIGNTGTDTDTNAAADNTNTNANSGDAAATTT